MRTRLTWVALAVAFAAILLAASGAFGSHRPPTLEQRATSLASEIRCPTCEGLSAEASVSQAAGAVRAAIREQVAQGRSDTQIKSYFVSRFGPDILLRPATSGLVGLVWILPVVAVVVAIGALGVTFRRWRSAVHLTPSDADRGLVAQALRDRHEAG